MIFPTHPTAAPSLRGEEARGDIAGRKPERPENPPPPECERQSESARPSTPWDTQSHRTFRDVLARLGRPDRESAPVPEFPPRPVDESSSSRILLASTGPASK